MVCAPDYIILCSMIWHGFVCLMYSRFLSVMRSGFFCPYNAGYWVGINDGLSRIRWTFSNLMDFTVYSIRCVYRAELIRDR